jgi:hypothetical protein
LPHRRSWASNRSRPISAASARCRRLAYSLAWLGASVGGIAMEQPAERFGLRATVIFGSLMIAAGLSLAQKRQRP